ncbi:MAG: efflux RND transporter periplasmic adaptor subunit [bacterium]
MKRKYRFFIFSLIFTTLPFLACNRGEKAEKEIIRPVRYQRVHISKGVHTRTFSGISKAGTEFKLSFRVRGTLQSIKIKVGDRIKQGDLIASIDDSDARLNYEKALVALKKSEIQKETAKSNLDRVRGLYENNNISLSEYEAAKEKFASADSSYNADKRNADLQERELSYYKLYSPIDGIIVGKEVEKNEYVQAGQVITVINASDDMEVNVGIPGPFITKVKTGQAVQVTFSSVADRVFEGKISEVSYTLNNQSSTYPVTVILTQPTKEIRPGMPAEVTFQFTSESKEGHLVVPANAVEEGTEGNFVFIVEAVGDGFAVVKKRLITVGRLTREGFEVPEGLQDGELVVTAGIANLTDGMKVRLLK